MVSSFKLRLLLVILVVAMASISMHSAENRSYVRPVLEYVLRDYGIESKILAWGKNRNDQNKPVSTAAFNRQNMQLPCTFLSVEQNFGWHWNSTTHQEQFFPGIKLKVAENTVVKPVMEGQVVELGGDEQGRTVLLQHNQSLYSLYGGLKEVLVDKGARITGKQALGKTGSRLYLEIRGSDGPLDPRFLLE